MHVEAPSLAAAVDDQSTLEEWFADDTARSAIATLFPHQGDTPLFLNPEVVKVISNMPMRRIAASDSSGLSHDQLDEMLAQLNGS